MMQIPACVLRREGKTEWTRENNTRDNAKVRERELNRGRLHTVRTSFVPHKQNLLPRLKIVYFILTTFILYSGFHLRSDGGKIIFI